MRRCLLAPKILLLEKQYLYHPELIYPEKCHAKEPALSRLHVPKNVGQEETKRVVFNSQED